VNSELGLGTTFFFTIPAAQRAEARVESAARSV
jgi:hypothetical protein